MSGLAATGRFFSHYIGPIAPQLNRNLVVLLFLSNRFFICPIDAGARHRVTHQRPEPQVRSEHASCVTEHPRDGMTHSVHIVSVTDRSRRICERRRDDWRWSSSVRATNRRRRRVVVPVRRRADELTGALRRLSGGRRGKEMRSNGARARKGQGADPCRRIAQLGC